MASQQAPAKDLQTNNLEFTPTDSSGVQWAEDISNSPSAQLNFSPSNNGCWAIQELQSLWKMFNSWLQPEKQTKEQMISQLVLEQFLLTGHCKDKYTLTEKWNVVCRFPHGARRASQGNSSHHVDFRSALTPADVPMEEQPKDLSRENISEDKNNCYNTSRNAATQVYSSDNIPRKKTDSLSINKRIYHPEPEVGDIPYGVPHDSTRASQGTSTCLQESLGECFSEKDPREVPGLESRQEEPISDPVLLGKNHEANLPCESHHKRFRRDAKLYKCEECSRMFKHARSLSSHQRTHLNKKSELLCFTCQKMFKRVSDRRTHEIIHMPEKPFKCSTCEKSFSHKTNLKSHEMIHTGEMPYVCSLCSRRFRQSSTYHRHLRNYHRSD